MFHWEVTDKWDTKQTNTTSCVTLIAKYAYY